MVNGRRLVLRLRILVTLLAAVAAMPSSAADTNGEFVVKGVGSKTCSDFVEVAAQGSRELSQYLGYVNGYTSAFNQINENTFDVWRWQSTDTILLLLLNRCRQEPELSFGAALAALTRYLDAAKIDTRVDVVRVGTTEKGFFLYEPVYADLLASLKAEGYQTTDPYAALMQYKKDHKLANSKNLHQMLLLRLLSNQDP